LGELDDLARKHPLVYKESAKFSFDDVKGCPDAYDEFPCFFYLVMDDRVVSSFRTFPDKIFIKGRTYPWAWSGSTLTDPSYRGRGLATILNREAVKILHQKGLARSAVFSADATVHIYKKLGFVFPGYVSRFLMLKSLRSFLEAHLRLKGICRILDLFSRPALRLIFRYIYGLRRFGTLDVKVDKVPVSREKEFVHSFPELHYQNRLHFNDSPSKLIWKTRVSDLRDENDCSLYLIREMSRREPLCYFVLRMKHQREPRGFRYKDFKLMTLMDFGIFKDDNRIYSTLLREIMSFFWKSDAEVLEIISNTEPFNSLMGRRGMAKVGKGVSFIFSVPRDWEWEGEWNELRNWHLTHFSGDAYSF
jgi:GNAT superfamily N-acetyltransferase